MRLTLLVTWFVVCAGASAARAQAEDEGGGDGSGSATEPSGDTGAAPAGGDTGAAPAGGDTGAAPAGGDMGMAMGGGVYTKETWPLELTKRPITLSKGMVEIRGHVFVSLSASQMGNPYGFFKPFSIAPDVYYGVSDKLSVGLTHSQGRYETIDLPPPTGTVAYLPPVPVGGLCLTGSSDGCPKAYNNLGLDAIFAFMQGDKAVAAHGGIGLPSLSPLLATLNVGVLARLTFGKIAVIADPRLRIGLTNRDAGNKEDLSVPVAIWFQATKNLAAGIDTGIGGPFSHFGDFYTVPVGLDALFAVSNKLDVGGQVQFPNAAGKNHTGDARALSLLVNFRL